MLSGLIALGVIAVAATAWVSLRGSHPPEAAPVAAAAAPDTSSVSAAGQFEPMEPVAHVSAPYIEGHPAIIASLKVAEGDHVHAGQVIAELTGKAQLEAAVRQAAARVSLQEVKLQQAQSSPKSGDINAQKALVARSQSVFENSQAEYKRYEALRQTHDVSVSTLESKRTAMETAQQELEEAKAHLAGLTELHAQDVQAANSELQLAHAELDRSQVDLAQTEVHAPTDGIVLHINARAGEEVGQQGIVELARTAEMDVLAEVYETDVSRIKVGQHAEVVSELLPAGTRLQGSVIQVGSEIGRPAIAINDDSGAAHTRVARVRIRLADPKAAASLIHGKVSVIIHS